MKFSKSLLLAVAAAGATQAKLIAKTVKYMDGDTELHGYLAWDDTWNTPRPAIIIASDWDGLTAHEKNWAERSVGLGYVGFANGVFTPEETETAKDMSKRGAITGKYANNNALWRGRQKASVDFLQSHPAVDKTKIGAVGFCFGGGGVLELARADFEGVAGVVSVHGNFGTKVPAEVGKFKARVLVLHGSSDPNILNTAARGDNSGAMPGLEAELDKVDATWEITKFSRVLHGFTEPSSPAYDQIATERSWSSLAHWFSVLFDSEADKAAVAAHTAKMAPNIHTEWVEYKDGNTALKGYLAYDKSKAGPLPAILVSHDWDGITEHEQKWARDLASQGFVAFANGVFTPAEDDAAESDVAARGATTRKYGADSALHRGRMKAAVDLLSSHPLVDQSKIGAVGFCFGGGSVLELARSNLPNVAGVVSVHGSLGTRQPATTMAARVLVLHGAQDANILNTAMRGDNSAVLPTFEAELDTANAEWELTRYSDTVHSFTEPAAGSNTASGNAYNELAARRAWASTTDFFGALFNHHSTYAYPNPVAPAMKIGCAQNDDCGVEGSKCHCAHRRRRLLFGGKPADVCHCAPDM